MGSRFCLLERDVESVRNKFLQHFFFLIEIGIDNVAVSERNFERKIIRDAIDFEEELFYLRSDTVESLFLDNRYLSTRLLIKLKRN